MNDPNEAGMPPQKGIPAHDVLDQNQHQQQEVNRLPNLEKLRGEHIGAYRAALAVDDRKRASKYLGKAYAVGEAIRRIRSKELNGRLRSLGLEWE